MRTSYSAILASLALTTTLALAADGTTPPPATSPAPSPASASPAPKLVVAEPVHDLGDSHLNETRRYDFVLRNEGDAPLHISKVESECPCLTATFDAVIAPRSTGAVHVTLDTSARRGAISYRLAVVSDDPAQTAAIVELKTLVKPKSDFAPTSFRLASVQHEPAVEKAITVWALDRPDFLVTSVESPYPFVKLTAKEVFGDDKDPHGVGRQWRVTATLDPEAPVGALTQFARLLTNHPTDSPIYVPVSGFMRPLVAVTPTEADLGEVERATYRKNLKFESFGQKPIAVTKAESDVVGARLEIATLTPGKNYAIWVSFDPKAATGPFSGTIRLNTDSPLIPVVEVPFRGTLR